MNRHDLPRIRPLNVLTMAVLASLAGCGGDSSSPQQRQLGDGYVHFSLPGAPQVESLYAVMLSQPERNFDELKVQANAPAIYNVQVAPDELFMLYAKDLDDEAQRFVQKSGADLDTAQGDPGKHIGMLLLTAEEMQRGGVRFNVLTDYISRALDEYTEQQTTERIKFYRDEIAQSLITQDLNGDGVIGFYDALVFDPDEPSHRAALVFDYAEMISKPAFEALNLTEVYTRYPDLLDQALDNAFNNYDNHEMPPPDNPSLHVVEVDTNLGGSIVVAEYPDDLITQQNQRRLYKLDARDGAPAALTLRAIADEGWRFMDWVGCPQVNADQSCTVRADQDMQVSAFFDNDEETSPDIPAPGVKNILTMARYAPSQYRYEVSDNGVMRFTNVSNYQLMRRIETLEEGDIVVAQIFEYPLMRVTRRVSASADRSSFELIGVPVQPHEVYQAVTAYFPPTKPSLDNIAMFRISYGDTPVEKENSTPRAFASATRQAQQRSKRVWTPGYGRAIEAGEGYYLIENPSGEGFQIISFDGDVQRIESSGVGTAGMNACEQDLASPVCTRMASLSMERFAQPAKGGSCSFLGLAGNKVCSIPLLEITIGAPKDPVFIGSIKIEGDFNAEVFAGTVDFKYSVAPPGMQLKTDARGLVTVTLGAKAFVGAQVKGDYAKSLAKSHCSKGVPVGRPRADADPQALANMAGNLPAEDDIMGQAGAALGSSANVDPIIICNDESAQGGGSKEGIKLFAGREPKFEIQIDAGSPSGLVMPIKAGVGAIAKWKGQAGITATGAYRVLIPWDLDVNLGQDCKKTDLGLFDATTCNTLSLNTKAEGKVKFNTNYKYDVKATINGEFSPGMEAYLTIGPRGLKEDLVKFGAGPSLPMKFVGSFSLWEGSNFPEDLAANKPNTCGFGKFAYAFGVDARFDVYGRVDPKLSIRVPVAGEIKFDFLKEFDIFRKYWEWEIVSPKMYKALGKSVDIYSRDSCLPLHKQPISVALKEMVWKAGELSWDTQNDQVVVQNHQLVLQRDGNLVLYKLNRKDGGRGGFDCDNCRPDANAPDESKNPVWASGTSSYPGARVKFQEDGNLVVYSVKESPLWSSDTWNVGANPKTLTLTDKGKLVIKDATGKELWSRN